jgi:hypothetical protein
MDQKMTHYEWAENFWYPWFTVNEEFKDSKIRILAWIHHVKTTHQHWEGSEYLSFNSTLRKISEGIASMLKELYHYSSLYSIPYNRSHSYSIEKQMQSI